MSQLRYVLTQCARLRASETFTALGTWEAVADFYNDERTFSKASYNRLARGEHVSDDVINQVLRRHLLPVLPLLKITEACPTCHEVHNAGDCHGKPVASVVTLAPGERVRKPRKQPERWVDFAVSALREALERRQLMEAEL